MLLRQQSETPLLHLNNAIARVNNKSFNPVSYNNRSLVRSSRVLLLHRGTFHLFKPFVLIIHLHPSWSVLFSTNLQFKLRGLVWTLDWIVEIQSNWRCNHQITSFHSWVVFFFFYESSEFCNKIYHPGKNISPLKVTLLWETNQLQMFTCDYSWQFACDRSS